ncbi:MAG: cadmium-translocating P-type ATPase [Micrococcaceae bacterium]|nr:cadmium-translocating P-type ATPase [Micrococcaceae bacterium]MDN5824285.1 cadmium-translocating P-type ATPase [Micrococcaceae bacterium]MDN5879025.1 cadmium-translocating P-type ATPase [Micrococcaceae bacterium]MDN5885797.1 cadmium-translocating P-type ATPase [Micrococcaceae bacterium]MDN5904068.1 cadmium-translocating P-type ATPase [Micrococcaceae bacterium]
MVILRFLRRYPLFAATVGFGLVTVGLNIGGLHGPARLVASGFALVVAATVCVDMVKDLLRGHWGIDVLALTAIVATVVVGEYHAALVICLMLTGGEGLEDAAQYRSRRELTGLLDRVPRTAQLVAPDGTVSETPLEDVAAGDIVLLRPSTVVPVDGTLLEGSADFDESAVTGESLPVTRAAGEPVPSGAVNGTVAVSLRATATAADSQYARIVALVQQAAESRAPLVRLADRYAVPFTLFAYLVGGLAWWLSGDPVRFAEVLVVATPCPLLIAAPVALMGGMSQAAREGAIVKDGGTLERLGRVKTAAFDKTGTLTTGTPRLKRIAVTPGLTGGLDADRVLELAASLEAYSTHAFAPAVTAAARTRGMALHPVEDATEMATEGISGTVEGHRVMVGKPRWIADHSSGFAPGSLQAGEAGVYLGIDGVHVGMLVMSDPLRQEAAGMMARLDRAGVKDRVMLTGDIAATAQDVARQVGLTDVRAELHPGQKVDLLAALPHRPVMMVGDGINDAPVLAAADVGIAMGVHGATAASESADVVIMIDDVSVAATAVEIGQRTVRVARQSIWIGILLSVGLMVYASTGGLPALFGALAQEVVDVVAIANALRSLSGPATSSQVRRTATAGSIQ